MVQCPIHPIHHKILSLKSMQKYEIELNVRGGWPGGRWWVMCHNKIFYSIGVLWAVRTPLQTTSSAPASVRQTAWSPATIGNVFCPDVSPLLSRFVVLRAEQRLMLLTRAHPHRGGICLPNQQHTSRQSATEPTFRERTCGSACRCPA